jgi:hypothetical protein
MTRIITLCLALSGVSSAANAQTIASADPLMAAIEFAMGQRAGSRPVVIDTVRTARTAENRQALLEELAGRLDAGLGVIEDYCFVIPPEPSDRAPLRRMQVRGASAVLVANFVDSTPEMALIRVTVWRGSGHHTGGTYELEVRPDSSGTWQVVRHLTTATAGCIPRT